MAMAATAAMAQQMPILAPLERLSHFSDADSSGGLLISLTVVELPLVHAR